MPAIVISLHMAADNCFGDDDDDDDNDASGIQSTHGRPLFTLPVTRISSYPTPPLPKVKKPYLSNLDGMETSSMRLLVRTPLCGANNIEGIFFGLHKNVHYLSLL